MQTQRFLRCHFDIGRIGNVPTCHIIMNWVIAFRRNASAAEKNTPGRPRTMRSPENVERVRTALQLSPRRSVLQHSQTLGLSDRRARRIINYNLHFHSFKLQIGKN
ncbi:hypothetical protein ANN_23389 [Periplaneta americana]|uniref:Uncharacterized protein n=1 Tax=Periplaneta americana TaxID=6978 RepID=A0ABQ8SL17_PERAM|nr:hypothetical protein ANN_23389 [Periplaneta americana]